MKSFNPWLLYKTLSSNNPLGYLSSTTLFTYLQGHGVNVTFDEILLFVRSLLPQFKDKLSYQEFLEVVLPYRRIKSRQKALK